MSRYSKFKERQANASPYANKAVCKDCRHCEYVRTKAFCNGFGAPHQIPDKTFWRDTPSYCTQYYPADMKDDRVNETVNDIVF